MGFRIKGEFPDTRYFSFNVYSLGDNTTQGSLIDYNIETDSGRPNPFVADADSMEVGQHFTVHILPHKHKDRDLPNILSFKDNVKLLSMIIRLYDYNIDDFGGVAFPTVEAFRVNDETSTELMQSRNLPRGLNLRTIVRNVSLPKMVKRLSVLYKTEHEVALDAPNDGETHYTVPFHAIDTRGFIENNDNRYLLAGITKHKREVYLFKFKSPSYTTGPIDINKTEVRYWSFNLGNAATYNYNAIKDEDAQVDGQGYVHILLADKDDALESRAQALGYNFLE